MYTFYPHKLIFSYRHILCIKMKWTGKKYIRKAWQSTLHEKFTWSINILASNTLTIEYGYTKKKCKCKERVWCSKIKQKKVAGKEFVLCWMWMKNTLPAFSVIEKNVFKSFA